jgi:hypothetical protein
MQTNEITKLAICDWATNLSNRATISVFHVKDKYLPNFVVNFLQKNYNKNIEMIAIVNNERFLESSQYLKMFNLFDLEKVEFDNFCIFSLFLRD